MEMIPEGETKMHDLAREKDISGAREDADKKNRSKILAYCLEKSVSCLELIENEGQT